MTSSTNKDSTDTHKDIRHWPPCVSLRDLFCLAIWHRLSFKGFETQLVEKTEPVSCDSKCHLRLMTTAEPESELLLLDATQPLKQTDWLGVQHSSSSGQLVIYSKAVSVCVRSNCGDTWQLVSYTNQALNALIQRSVSLCFCFSAECRMMQMELCWSAMEHHRSVLSLILVPVFVLFFLCTPLNSSYHFSFYFSRFFQIKFNIFYCDLMW